MYVTSKVRVPLELLFYSPRAQLKWIGSRGFSSSNWINLSTLPGLVVIIHWCSMIFPALIPAEESIRVKCFYSFISEVPNIIYVLRVTYVRDPMALVWFELRLSVWIFRLKLRIMGISLSYLLWVILPFYSSTLVYYQFPNLHIDWFLFFCAVDNSSGLDFF